MQQVEVAKKGLPSPPFLVAAIIEALCNSEYASRTLIVEAEADAFCAAKAYSLAQEVHPTISTAIFTNDSDLVIWDTGPQSRVIMIDEMSEHDEGNGKVLEAFFFWPGKMQKTGSRCMSNLIQPAFQMLDPKVSFAQAMANVNLDTNTNAFSTFSSMYWIHLVLKKLETMQARDPNDRIAISPDARVEELLNHLISDIRRKTEAGNGQIDPVRMAWIRADDDDKTKEKEMKGMEIPCHSSERVLTPTM